MCAYVIVGSGGASDDEDDGDTYSAAESSLAAHRRRMSAKEKSLLRSTQKIRPSQSHGKSAGATLQVSDPGLGCTSQSHVMDLAAHLNNNLRDTHDGRVRDPQRSSWTTSTARDSKEDTLACILAMLQEAKIDDPWANTWLDDVTGWQAAAELTVDHITPSEGSIVGNLQLLSKQTRRAARAPNTQPAQKPTRRPAPTPAAAQGTAGQ